MHIFHPKRRKTLAFLFILWYNQLYHKICGYGGIGRRAGFRFQFERVEVQVLLTAPNKKDISVWQFRHMT